MNVSENVHIDTQTKTQSILTLSTDPRTSEEYSIQKMIGKAMSVMLSRQVWRVQGDQIIHNKLVVKTTIKLPLCLNKG